MGELIVRLEAIRPVRLIRDQRVFQRNNSSTILPRIWWLHIRRRKEVSPGKVQVDGEDWTRVHYRANDRNTPFSYWRLDKLLVWDEWVRWLRINHLYGVKEVTNKIESFVEEIDPTGKSTTETHKDIFSWRWNEVSVYVKRRTFYKAGNDNSYSDWFFWWRRDHRRVMT